MNGIIIVDKPQEWTSHDVVAKLRGIFKERRIGHGGTLDPMATGVLPVFIGRATRAVEFCEADEKEYVAHLRTGIITDTQDITGAVLEKRLCSFSEEKFIDALSKFKGKQEQVPPMYSAVKIGGKKLYELARKGVQVERKPREIEIKELDYMGRFGEDYIIKVVCSKGTYIRTLCNDIGQHLGCGAAMSYLRRTRAGVFKDSASVTIEQILESVSGDSADKYILPVDALFSKYGRVRTETELQLKSVMNGGGYRTEQPDGIYRVYGPDDEFLMLGKVENGHMKTIKSFFEVKR